MKSWLSLRGLYEWDPTILDGLQLPEGVDRDTLVPNLLLESQESEILFPDPVSLSYAIRVWSASRMPTWQRIYDALQLEYDPIANYDRTEEETVSYKEAGDYNNSGSGSTTQVGTMTTQRDTDDYTAGFNDSSTQADTATARKRETETVRPAGWGTNNSIADRGADNRAGDSTRKIRAYGNIGVTTSQQMVEAEIELAEHNIYKYIIDDFIGRFCLLVF